MLSCSTVSKQKWTNYDFLEYFRVTIKHNNSSKIQIRFVSHDRDDVGKWSHFFIPYFSNFKNISVSYDIIEKLLIRGIDVTRVQKTSQKTHGAFIHSFPSNGSSIEIEFSFDEYQKPSEQIFLKHESRNSIFLSFQFQ